MTTLNPENMRHMSVHCFKAHTIFCDVQSDDGRMAIHGADFQVVWSRYCAVSVLFLAILAFPQKSPEDLLNNFQREIPRTQLLLRHYRVFTYHFRFALEEETCNS